MPAYWKSADPRNFCGHEEWKITILQSWKKVLDVRYFHRSFGLISPSEITIRGDVEEIGPTDQTREKKKADQICSTLLATAVELAIELGNPSLHETVIPIPILVGISVAEPDLGKMSFDPTGNILKVADVIWQ
jgi:hypothetical protein